MAISSDKALQQRLLEHVNKTFNYYKDSSQKHRDTMAEVFEVYNTYSGKVSSSGSVEFITNKCAEGVEKTLPRIIAKNPKFIASSNTDDFGLRKNEELEIKKRIRNGETEAVNELIDLKEKNNEDISFAVATTQAYLNYIFERYNLKESLRLWVKNMLVYGYSIAKVKYCYSKSRSKGKGGITEKIVGEYPSIDVKSWTEVYIDPRFRTLQEMPSIIEIKQGVRYNDLKQNDEYFNLDMVNKVTNIQRGDYQDWENYKEKVQSILGIDNASIKDKYLTKDNIDLKVYYGYINEEGYEGLYEITTAEDMVVIGFKEIVNYPFVDIKAFDNPEGYYATGLVERGMSLQKELNFKKQAFAESVNQALFRSYLYDTQLGVSPDKLQSKAGNMIKVKDVRVAEQHLKELEFRPLPSEYFNEVADLERQIENAMFAVNTTNPKNSSALTDTVTGIRMQSYDQNGVIQLLTDKSLDAFARLGYKLIESARDNTVKDLVIKDMDTGDFWEINKELFTDAEWRYLIRIEANSSSFDSMETRREDAIAKANIGVQAMQAGLPVDLEALYKDVFKSFEGTDPNQIFGKKKEEAQAGQEMATQPIEQMGAIPQDQAEQTNEQIFGSVGQV